MGEQAKSSNPFVRVGTKGNAHSLLGMKMALEARFLAIVIVKNGFHPSFIKLVSGSQVRFYSKIGPLIIEAV